MTLYTVMDGRDQSARIAQMIDVWFPDAVSILDTTYGSGKFWSAAKRNDVVGLDLDPSRAKDVCADFTSLPFIDDAFDLVVFDPPYMTDMGKGKPSVMGSHFGTYPTIAHLHSSVRKGAREAERVARVGVLVKVQDYCHASQIKWMDKWVEDALGSPYDRVILTRKSKIIDPKWGGQLTAYRNHAVFLAFRKDGPIHKRRGVAA